MQFLQQTYLGHAMINIWTVRFVEYFPGVRIVFTVGYIIVHEDHYILIFQAPSLQDLIRMANISLPSPLVTKLYQHTEFYSEISMHRIFCEGRGCSSARVPDGGNCHNLRIRQLEQPNEYPSRSYLHPRFSLRFFHPKVSAAGSRNSRHRAIVTERVVGSAQNP